jgi:hypothetical protein
MAASRRRGQRAVDDPAQTPQKPPAKPASGSGGSSRSGRARAPAARKPRAGGGRTGRITVYAEVSEDDRRDLTITAAMLGVEKGQLVRALLREHTSDSPSPQQLDRLHELLDKHG